MPRPNLLNALLDKLFELEGGDKIHTVEGDPGGTTKWGISQRAYPHLDIANLTRKEAELIVIRDYWTPIRGWELPFPLATVALIAAFNMGTASSIRCLQHAINSVGRVTNVDVDGRVGPKTLAAAHDASSIELLVAYVEHIIVYYQRLGKDAFLRGWRRRALKSLVFATQVMDDAIE